MFKFSSGKAKHTLHCLQGTKTFGICYTEYTQDQNSLHSIGHYLNGIYGVSDSDFAGCKDTAWSTSGYVVLWYGGMCLQLEITLEGKVQ